MSRFALKVAGIAAALVAVPAAANAVTIYVTDNYAYNTGYTKVTACDQQSDGNSVYSDWRAVSNSGRVTTGGGSGTCAAGSMSSLRSFNVCEQVPAFPDFCSDRVYI